MIDLPGSVFTQRDALVKAQPRLRELMTRVDRPQDLSPLDWSLFYALALSFKPDRIVELGRGFGNSTAAFTQAARDIGDCKVVSVDRDIGHTWQTWTLPLLEGAIDADWLSHLDVLQADILDVPTRRLFGDAKRVMLLWDAHGDELGRHIIAELMPALRNREHVVILHDVTDARWQDVDPAYGSSEDESFWQGHLVCAFEEIYAAMDFIARNAIEADTPSHAFDAWLQEQKTGDAMAMRAFFKETLGSAYFDEGYSSGGHWLYFDLATRTSQAPLAFPAPARRNLLKRAVSRGLQVEAVDKLVWRVSRAKASLRPRR